MGLDEKISGITFGACSLVGMVAGGYLTYELGEDYSEIARKVVTGIGAVTGLLFGVVASTYVDPRVKELYNKRAQEKRTPPDTPE